MTEETSTEERTQEFVNAKVNSELKAKCLEYVESDPNTSSISHLVRKALLQTINNDPHQQQNQAQNTLGDGDEMVEIKQELRELRALTNQLKSTLDAVEVRTREPSEEIEQLKAEIFGALPSGTDDILKSNRGEVRFPLNSAEDNIAHSGKISSIARVLGVDEYEVERAIPYLRKDNHRIQTIEIDGETRYYKEV